MGAPAAGAGRGGRAWAGLPGAEGGPPPLLYESEDLAGLFRQLGDRITEAALAEGSEEGEILSHLSGRSPTETRELIARDRLETLAFDPLQKAEVQGEAPYR